MKSRIRIPISSLVLGLSCLLLASCTAPQPASDSSARVNDLRVIRGLSRRVAAQPRRAVRKPVRDARERAIKELASRTSKVQADLRRTAEGGRMSPEEHHFQEALEHLAEALRADHPADIRRECRTVAAAAERLTPAVQ